MNTLIKSFWKSLIWLLFIFYLTLTPSENLPDMPKLFEYDKIGHFVIFAIFSILLIKSIVLISIENFSLLKSKILVFFISTFFSGIIEILQANYIRNRNGDITDFVADIIGILIGILTYDFLAKKFYKLI